MLDQLVEVEVQDQPVEVVVEVVFNTAVHVIRNNVLHVISITAYVIPSKVHVFLCMVSYVTTSLTVHVTRNVVEHVTHVTRVHNVILVPMNPMNIIDIQNMAVEEEMDLWVKLLPVEYEAVSLWLETSLYLVFTKMMVWSSFVIFLQARALRLVMLCCHLSVMPNLTHLNYL